MGDNSNLYSKAESDAHHRRGYQACDPCRKRKVKCDLGTTRRKRKTSDAEEDEVEAAAILHRDKRMMIGEVAKNESPVEGPPFAPSDPPQFGHEAVLAQQRWSETPAPHAPHAPPAPPAPPAPRYTPSVPTTRAPTYPVSERPAPPSYGGPPMMNRTAVELLSPAITNTHDALHLLSEAAGRTEDLNRQSLENRLAARQSVSSFNSGPSPLPQGSSPRSLGGSFVRTPRSGMSMGGSTYYPAGASGPVDPHIADPGPQRESPVNNPPPEPNYLDAIRAWSRLRFVRAGWLTVEEGMDYVEYYYEHLAPMSPVVIPDFSHPSTHRTLLTDEPVLAVTILTIASRHLKPKGEGANTRAFYIHDRLWAYLRSMIERLFWGQEKFDAGTSGIGRPRSLDLSSSMSGKGSVEWHPRNLHFPPGDDENSLLDTDPQTYSRADNPLDNDGEPTSKGSEGRVAFQKWLEPAWRSDRMSWMLLSTAQALAFELGVFDPKGDAKVANEPLSEQTRKRRLRRLILVFITHSSGRLGIPSMLPLPQWGQDITPTSADAKDADANLDRMQDCWISISKIVYQANHLLFASSDQTMDLIRSGRYREQIDRFQPYLREFQQQLDSVNLSPAMRSVLLIELEYTRLYINSLALQAVVDRWTTMSNESAQSQNQNQNGQPGPGPSNSSNSWFQTLNELYRVNEHYIQQVIDSSRKILQTVLDGLVPEGRLRHAPIRTFFRILSGMIFILKTFTLGAREDDVRVSLDLQDRTVEALRNYVVDDVHLSNTVARLLELLTSSIRTRFLRFAPHDRGADGEGPDRTSVPDSGPHSPSREHSTTRRDGPSTPWPANQGHDTTSGGSGLGYVDTPGSGHPMVSGHDPLANIPAQPINSSNLNVSFMPPPPSVYHNYYESNSTFPANDMDRSSPNQVASSQTMGDSHHSTSGALPDWFALPLDQFFNSSTGVVDQGLGGTGPMLGEFDMLEVLLNEGYDGNTNGEGETGAGLSSQYL
ncbi:hypothetical protein PEX1_031470 [Penicillium expansum]|uniref:Transcription factor, fungi n=1 Tax=Penicillium expansum TaxID=27334 RepID=A0A0A2K454_PENEN|nr:hypothetical protein PEX2_015250 [Penicillium expansum]KGO40967.1 hypothetical protein PEXP_087500 [Penicillium expansum]KGO54916.1 hypothetical protein PEX1_031470 [Penicillium expansum]KGO61846.1 hypothetical protein PEX2_015250 [Penicillium expansum]